MDPFIGMIIMFGGNFAPRGWAICDGQVLAINQNQALFSILGTAYGGDGVTTFGLPDLRGRVPIHAGSGPGLSSYALGQTGGAETVTLTTQQIPAHQHGVTCSSARGTTADPKNAIIAGDPDNPYVASGTESMSPAMIQPTGGGGAHPNVQPYRTVNFIIALVGTYPSRN